MFCFSLSTPPFFPITFFSVYASISPTLFFFLLLLILFFLYLLYFPCLLLLLYFPTFSLTSSSPSRLCVSSFLFLLYLFLFHLPHLSVFKSVLSYFSSPFSSNPSFYSFFTSSFKSIYLFSISSSSSYSYFVSLILTYFSIFLIFLYLNSPLSSHISSRNFVPHLLFFFTVV